MERGNDPQKDRLMASAMEEETFRRVWQRVQNSTQILPETGPEPARTLPELVPDSARIRPQPAPSRPRGEKEADRRAEGGEFCPRQGCFLGGEVDSRALAALVAEMVAAAAEYGAMARRGRGQTLANGLQGAERRKTRQGKRLAAAYFLMTGVRYWPEKEEQGRLARESSHYFGANEPMLAFLRRRFLAEERLAETLKALGQKAFDPCLRELYLSLAEETEELAAGLRGMVEGEMGR